MSTEHISYRELIRKRRKTAEARLKLISKSASKYEVAEDPANQAALDRAVRRLRSGLQTCYDHLGVAGRETLRREERTNALSRARKRTDRMAAELEKIKALANQLPMLAFFGRPS